MKKNKPWSSRSTQTTQAAFKISSLALPMWWTWLSTEARRTQDKIYLKAIKVWIVLLKIITISSKLRRKIRWNFLLASMKRLIKLKGRRNIKMKWMMGATYLPNQQRAVKDKRESRCWNYRRASANGRGGSFPCHPIAIRCKIDQ